MNPRSLIAAISLAAAASAHAGTAYEALQVIKGTRGDTILNQLIEARGESGQPQPQSWTILMNDPAARGGIREFVVSGDQILSERTPARGTGGRGELPALNFSRLNLDSDGAFDIAVKQAVARKVAFNSIDYTLRTNDVSGAPLWVLRLFDYMGAPVGGLQVSAEDGKIVKPFAIDTDARVAAEPAPLPPPSHARPDATPLPPPPPAADESSQEMGGVIGTMRQTGRTVGTAVKDTTLNVVGTVQEVFTGRRTIGSDSEDNE